LLSILSNPSALAANRVLAVSGHAIERAIGRLGSGLRINSARDDAAGLAISTRLVASSRQAEVDLRSMNDMVSLLQVADGSLATTGDNLQRIRELAVQAANGTNNASDRLALQREAGTLIEASRQRQARTTFNGQSLLDGSLHIQGFVGQSDAAIGLHLAPLFLSRTTDVLFRYAQLAQATTSTTPTGALLSGGLSIQGRAIGATSAGSAAGQGADSAWALARAIGNAGIEGLVASANATRVNGSEVLPPDGGTVTAGAIVVNGVPVGAGNFVHAINGIAGLTGVTATAVAGAAPPGFPASVPITLVLSASDGRNIAIAGASAFGMADQQAIGSVTITGPLAERPGSNLRIGGSDPGSAGLASSTIIAVDSGDPVVVALDEAAGYDQNPNLTTAQDASVTIGIIDRKLEKLLALRTQVGAALNALDMRHGALSARRESAAAAVSRILDADYATEIADFTRADITRSAALAMLAQANLLPQQILSLLLPAEATRGDTAALAVRPQ